MAVQQGGYEHCGTRLQRSTLRLNGPGLGLFAALLLQHPSQSQQAASGARRVMLASDPYGTPFLMRRNLLLWQFPVAKLQLPTISMIMRTMCLSGSNRSSLQMRKVT